MAEKDAVTPYTSFLGTGWSFPPEFLREAGSVRMSVDEEDIAESLRILLGTTLGERLFVPEYGLNLHELLFEPLSTTMKTLVKERVRTGILVYEPRINLLDLALDDSAQNEGLVRIAVEYEVRSTNSRYNLVYPFYAGAG